MSSKRQTTMAKLQRERAVKERRALKLEKKQAAAAAKHAEATADTVSAPEGEDTATDAPEE